MLAQTKKAPADGRGRSVTHDSSHHTVELRGFELSTGCVPREPTVTDGKLLSQSQATRRLGIGHLELRRLIRNEECPLNEGRDETDRITSDSL